MKVGVRSVIQTCIAICFLIIAVPVTIAAQDPDADEVRRLELERRAEEERQRIEAEQQEQIKAAREAMVNEERADAENAVLSASRNRPSADIEFVHAASAFRQAVEEYRHAIRTGQPIQKPLKDIDRLLPALKAYFKQARLQGSSPDKNQFKDLSRNELISETLTSAEGINRKLQQALTLVESSRRSDSVSIDSMLFLQGLHSDILRLELLKGKLK